MHLTGLKDDYVPDGRVVSEILSQPNAALSARGVEQLGACYKQLNSSVGVFGTATLQASTKGIESLSSADRVYTATERALTNLDRVRDAVGGEIKLALNAAASAGHRVDGVPAKTTQCAAALAEAARLAQP